MFRKSAMASHINMVVENIDELLTIWQRRNSLSDTRLIHTNIIDEVSCLSFNLVAKQLFAGYDLCMISEDKYEQEQAHRIITSMIDIAQQASFMSRYGIPEPLAYIYQKMSSKFRRAVRIMYPVAEDIVNHLIRLQFENEERWNDSECAKSLKDTIFIKNDQLKMKNCNKNEEGM
jgi:hypothetical protein